MIVSADPDPDTASSPLTKREIECLYWASLGKTSWEIGSILGFTERTANFHIGNACSKMNVRTRQAAIAVALQAGYLDVMRLALEAEPVTSPAL